MNLQNQLMGGFLLSQTVFLNQGKTVQDVYFGFAFPDLVLELRQKWLEKPFENPNETHFRSPYAPGLPIVRLLA
jgi:hypothetical protein